MHASLKSKVSQKKPKARRSIENDIPEIPRISDFQEIDHEEVSVPSDAIDDTTANELKKLDLGKQGNENEEKEKKNIFESRVLTEIEGQSSNDLKLQPESENNTLESSNHPSTLETQNLGTLADEIIRDDILGNEIKKSELHCSPSSKMFTDSSKGSYCDHLSIDMEESIEGIKEPSAPAVEINTTENNTLLKQFSGNTFSDIDRLTDIKRFNFTAVLQNLLIPYSDIKLSEYYCNPQLDESETYVNEFINQEIKIKREGNNKFYKLLMEYMQLKNRLRGSETKIKEVKENINTCISAVWTVWNDVTATGKEKCSDGNIVTFVQKYTQVQFNTDIFKDFTAFFLQIKHEVYEVYLINSFLCALLRLKIQYFIQCLLTSCPEFTMLEKESAAVLSNASSNSHFQQCLLDLKLGISILFIFQRKQSLDIDSGFLEETRHWLLDLAAVLLRIGSWKDHVFLLHHILRCPGGVGEWAAEFIQLPFPVSCSDPFKDPHINHMMTVLSILLSPIEQRERFIKKLESEITNDINQWTIIDSDGEAEDDDQYTCPLKESDLVSLLNQIPFSKLFKAVLKCDGVEIESNFWTPDDFLKLLSFLTNFIKILKSGLKLYSTQRYRQFTKRLGRLIYHIVEYATDILAVIRSQISENEMMRIQAEYDNFFLRSAKYIYSAKKHGTWQFLATIPYHMPSSNAILKLYGILQLNNGEDDSIVKVDFTKFSEKFLELPEEEQFYLLTTFANMALARDIVELLLIKSVLIQLLFIGFLNQSTMDHCYKNVRSLLSSICSSHPFLMSEILCIQRRVFISDPDFDQALTLSLWAKLPIATWRPEKRDLEILSTWLLEPINSTRNEIARFILQSLDYGMHQGEFFLPVELHYTIALIILQAKDKWNLQNETGVIKNVSNLVLYQNPDQSINEWVWNVLLKLRLHLLDKSDAEMCRCFYNLPIHLKNIPDVESNIELQRMVLKNQPVACYIALMTTTLGHSVPIMCERGFELVDVLFSLGSYEPGLSCLEYMMMLFLDCNDSLYKCEKFISLLSRLIAADNSYVQFAKNLISYKFPGPVLKCVEGMMQNQLNRWRGLNFSYFSGMIKLWLLSLTRLPLWTQEPGVLYLMDKLLQNSFFDGASMKMITALLKDLFYAQSPPSEARSFSSLVGWMNSKYTPPTLLPKGFNGEFPWFAYQIIHLEFELNEKDPYIWVELLKELCSCCDKKINVDNSLKKVCNLLRMPVRSSSVLAIYKWTYQILETDCSHPLVPLIWQRFFSLYFARVPGQTDHGSVGEKFFDGVINQGLFKRIKAKLQETRDYYKTVTENTEEGKGHEHYLKCYNLFQTFSVWLYDPNLHKPCLSLHMLPVQYSPELLGLIIHGSEAPWIEFLEYQNIEQNLKSVGLSWSNLKNRTGTKTRYNIISHKKEKLPKEKLYDRLSTYENPLPPPHVDFNKYALPKVNLNAVMNVEKLNLFVKPHVEVLLEYLKHFVNGVNEHVSLSCDMQELLPNLYETAESTKLLKCHCSGVNKVVNGKNVLYSCSGPAVVKLIYQESKLNEKVKQQFGQSWNAFEENLEKAMTPLPSNLTSAAIFIEVAIEILKHEYRLSRSRNAEDKITKDLKETGSDFFEFLIRTWCERIVHVPPLEKIFENYVESLAEDFIEGNPEANGKLLQFMLTEFRDNTNQTFGNKVCNYFTPNSFSTGDFIENYSKALNFLSEERFLILSKFNLQQWLSERRPRFSERSRLISIVGDALKSLGKNDEDQKVLKLLNQNLEILFMYDFPEHYGEVLNFLLEASETQSIFANTWFTFLNALASGHCTFVEGRIDKNNSEVGQSIKKLKHYFSKYAAEQNLLSFEVIKGTITLLATVFKTQRLKLGTRGLYKKYIAYLEPIFIFFGMLSHSVVTKALEVDTGSLSDKLAQYLWPLLSDLYSPWLVPYWVERSKGQTPQGIQEQNLEPLAVLPWLLNDSCYASFCASIFAESIRFLFDALPGLSHVLSHVWVFYVTNFAHIYVKDYILNVIHDSLLTIPWETFFPSLQDMELMLKVVDQFLPLSHSFLGSIFVNVKWTELVHYFLRNYDLETTTKLHICLLHLLVKLPLEPSLKQNDKVLALLTEANGYAWHLVDSFTYEAVLNWFIMSCDPRIILMDERLEYYKLDSTILSLLQVCAGYVPFAKSFHPTTLSKRLLFVRTCVKWLITSNRRFKSKESPLFKVALNALWTDMETVVNETVPLSQKTEETSALLSEFLMIFTESDLCSVVETALSTWLSTRRSPFVIFGLFRAVGVTVENPNVFGSIIESSLENYFSFTENGDWKEVADVLTIHSKLTSSQLEKVLIDHYHFLTLYAVLVKKFSKRELDLHSRIVLTDLLQLLGEIKPNSNLEPKLILLIIFGLSLMENEVKRDTKEGILCLVKLFDQLNSFINDKGNGFLSVVGLKKPGSSNRFRLSCLITCCGIVVFLKTSYPEFQDLVDEKVLQTLETAEGNKIYQNIHQYASYAKTVVKNISTIEEIFNLLKHVGFKLFNKLYVK